MQSPRSVATAASLHQRGIDLPVGTIIETQDGRALPFNRETIRSVADEAMIRGGRSLCTATAARLFLRAAAVGQQCHPHTVQVCVRQL
jgi:hypothetical protein